PLAGCVERLVDDLAGAVAQEDVLADAEEAAGGFGADDGGRGIDGEGGAVAVGEALPAGALTGGVELGDDELAGAIAQEDVGAGAAAEVAGAGVGADAGGGGIEGEGGPVALGQAFPAGTLSRGVERADDQLSRTIAQEEVGAGAEVAVRGATADHGGGGVHGE